MIRKILSIVPLLLLLSAADVVSAKRKLGGGYGPTEFVSYFDIDYQTMYATDQDVELAAQVMATSYNRLMQDVDDPHGRVMGRVEVLETTTGRRLTEQDKRDLQSGGIGVVTRVTGFCNLCGDDFFFTDQLSGRRLSKSSGKGKGKGGSSINTDPPTEAELLAAYSEDIQHLSLGNIVDVIALDELADAPDIGSGKGKGKGGKGSKKSTGTSKSTGGSKSSKKSGKSKGGSKGSKKSGKGKGKGYSCPPVAPLEGDSGEFESFFDSIYALAYNSGVGVEQAAEALATAYNRVMTRYAAESLMTSTSLYDYERKRHLSWDEVRERELQGSTFDAVIRATGFCRGCSFGFTIGDQLSRKLQSDGCPLPGLPSTEEVRLEYNVVLEEMDIDNIESCDYLAEIDRPSPGKGKGKGGSKSGSKSGNRKRFRH